MGLETCTGAMNGSDKGTRDVAQETKLGKNRYLDMVKRHHLHFLNIVAFPLMKNNDTWITCVKNIMSYTKTIDITKETLKYLIVTFRACSLVEAEDNIGCLTLSLYHNRLVDYQSESYLVAHIEVLAQALYAAAVACPCRLPVVLLIEQNMSMFHPGVVVSLAPFVYFRSVNTDPEAWQFPDLQSNNLHVIIKKSREMIWKAYENEAFIFQSLASDDRRQTLGMMAIQSKVIPNPKLALVDQLPKLSERNSLKLKMDIMRVLEALIPTESSGCNLNYFNWPMFMNLRRIYCDEVTVRPRMLLETFFTFLRTVFPNIIPIPVTDLAQDYFMSKIEYMEVFASYDDALVVTLYIAAKKLACMQAIDLIEKVAWNFSGETIYRIEKLQYASGSLNNEQDYFCEQREIKLNVPQEMNKTSISSKSKSTDAMFDDAWEAVEEGRSDVHPKTLANGMFSTPGHDFAEPTYPSNMESIVRAGPCCPLKEDLVNSSGESLYTQLMNKKTKNKPAPPPYLAGIDPSWSES